MTVPDGLADPDGATPPAAAPPDDVPAPSLDETLRRSRVLTVPVCLLTGLAVGLLGTVMHRAVPPWGLVVVLVTALSGAVLSRALAGGLGLAAYGGAVVLVTQLMSQLRPGDDAVVASDATGYAWLFGAVLLCAVVAFLPGRWFGPGRP